MADDDDDLRTMYCQVLKSRGLAVISARDGSDAVSKFINERPEIVMLDHNMPRYSGLQAASEILALRPSTKVIMLTAASEVLREAEACGVDMFLVKPISAKTLIQSISALSNLRPSCQIVPT
ncbi:MAG: response regulator [archaeon]|nr:response regulator [archaeon]